MIKKVASDSQFQQLCNDNGVQIFIGRGIQSLSLLADEWPDFLSRCGIHHPFATADWIQCWYAAFDIQAEAQVVWVRKEGRLVVVFPVMRADTHVKGLKVRRMTSWVNTHSFRSATFVDPDYIDLFTAALFALQKCERWDFIDIPYVTESNVTTKQLATAIEEAGLDCHVEPGMSSPRLEITGSWDDFVKNLSRSRRESERRKARKLLDKANGRLEIIVGRVVDLDKRLADCWRISSQTWKHPNGSSIASCPKRMRFYENLAKLPRNWVVLGLLYIDDSPVAFEYNLLDHDRMYNLKLGYAEASRAYSPGQVLRFEMLKWAFVNNVSIFDFMGNAAEYKSKYSTDVLPHYNIRIYSTSAVARTLANYQKRLHPLLRKIKARWKK